MRMQVVLSVFLHADYAWERGHAHPFISGRGLLGLKSMLHLLVSIRDQEQQCFTSGPLGSSSIVSGLVLKHYAIEAKPVSCICGLVPNHLLVPGLKIASLI